MTSVKDGASDDSAAAPANERLREEPSPPARLSAGSQTLARGLSALQAVSSSATGITAQQVADHIGVHRTIAYRLLSTLAQQRFVVKGEHGRYRPAAALAVLGASFDNNLRALSVPTLRTLADDLGATASLLVAEGDQQVAIAVIVPTLVFYQLSFHEGSRYPLERGSAGIALLASMPPRPGERDLVPLTREQGWVITHGEVEPDTYGLAVPVRRRPPSPPTCINLISHRKDVLLDGRDAVITAAKRLSDILG
jgi:DNA-binding IclR family transcriptional regulator